MMTDHTTILVPIRYPLTDDSARTLAAAGRLACENAPAELLVLHVNLFQNDTSIQTADLTEAISSTLEGVEASVTTRRGFLVEKVILEEVDQIDADIVVLGANQQTRWRRFLSRLLWNDPAVSAFLREHATDEIEIREIDTRSETAPVEVT